MLCTTLVVARVTVVGNSGWNTTCPPSHPSHLLQRQPWGFQNSPRLGWISGYRFRIFAFFGKYRISRYQGNLARFLWSQLPSLKYSLSLSSGSTGCSHLRKTVWLGKSWQSINYLEVTYWLFSIYSKNTLQVQYFANSPSYHLSSFFRVFFLLGTSPN